MVVGVTGRLSLSVTTSQQTPLDSRIPAGGEGGERQLRVKGGEGCQRGREGLEEVKQKAI